MWYILRKKFQQINTIIETKISLSLKVKIGVFFCQKVPMQPVCDVVCGNEDKGELKKSPKKTVFAKLKFDESCLVTRFSYLKVKACVAPVEYPSGKACFGEIFHLVK